MKNLFGNDISVITKAEAPSKQEKLIMKGLIWVGVASVVVFLVWFFGKDRMGYPWLYWPLTFALLFKLLRKLHEWYHYYNISVPQKPEKSRSYSVDILTTACPGEPKEMILTTLKAMQDIKYPHTSYLCDEGDDPELKKACEEMGVVHVTRTEKVNAKAGNINNALKQAKGEICVILDPDHIPHPDFLDRVLPYFEDPKMGFVQIVQAYYNRKESLVALGACEQTYHFYGPMMMCMNSYGTAQAIGANCTFRRSALDSIGGHAAGLAEDMHTSMQLHAKGWKSAYVPEILSKGLVPSTLSGYYKQQIKWSRGTFELLFTTFPKLFKNFTLRQKIHYFTLPLYYLFGIITLIDLFVPATALFISEVPWQVDIAEFSLFMIPVIVLSLLIRMYSQRWVLETHERGFHMVGGLLRIGTWWVFIIGFIYTLFRINVPYIPTPKDDKPHNDWKLCIPNIAACLVCLVAIIYGLNIDWSPLSFFMSGFAAMNFLILGYVVFLGQQKLIFNVIYYIRNSPLLKLIQKGRLAWWYSRHSVYNLMRNSTLAVALSGVFFLLSYTMIEYTNKQYLSDFNPPEEKSTGGFYLGVFIPETSETYDLAPVEKMEQSLDSRFDIVSIYQAWGPESLTDFPDQLIREVADSGGTVMITWEPWASTFPQYKNHPDLGKENNMLPAIYLGFFDDYLKAYAEKIRNTNTPVFIRFAHEPDNLGYPWSPAGNNRPEDFVKAWKYVVAKFVEEGVSNVSWVWNPLDPSKAEAYYPGDYFVDWIGVTCLNYGLAGNEKEWRSFSQIYKPYKDALKKYNKPIMLAEFGSTYYGGNPSEWLKAAFQEIPKHDEIRSVVFFHSKKDKNWVTDWKPDNYNGYIDWTFNTNNNALVAIKDWIALGINDKIAPMNKSYVKKTFMPYVSPQPTHCGYIKSENGKFTLYADGKPFYIKGVAYNPGHDWRDGDMPVTRSIIKKDFLSMLYMGANTIRRYEPGLYDKNIMSLADDYELKILHGFWFDPKIDYYRDTMKVEEIISKVESYVLENKGNNAILAWSLGNETWGLLKHHYAQPYLTKVRQEYLKMVEYLARRVHEIDPTKPVFTASEHSWQLSTELRALSEQAPSLDFIGINSYYEEQISQVDSLHSLFDPERPYLISEFGPRGYWNKEYSKFKDDTILLEDSDFEKAILYASQWNSHIEAHKGKNLGGIAYCWRDRLEGTATWFGLTDFKGRKKPAFYTLLKSWTPSKLGMPMHNVFIDGPKGPFMPGKTYQFKVVSDNNLFLDTEYNWQFRREEYLEPSGSLETSDNGTTVTVTIPDEPSKYRLYLYASDENGNVVTSSYPVPVSAKPVKNPPAKDSSQSKLQSMNLLSN